LIVLETHLHITLIHFKSSQTDIHYLRLIMSVINNIPTQCGCNTASKAPCKNKIMFIFNFNDGHREREFSCGIHAHVNSIYTALNIHDSVLVMKKRNNSINTFDVLYHNASCFDVHLHHKLFFGPLNIKHTAYMTYENSAIEFIRIRTRFYVDYNPTIHAQKMSKMKYHTYVQRGEDMSYQDQSQLAYLMQYFKRYNDAYKNCLKYAKFYLDAKKAHEELLHIQLPWTNQIYNECSICIDNVQPHNGGHITCGHSFHNECIQNWIAHNHDTCPNCRIKFDNYLV